VSAGIRRWIFNALGVLALCLLMTGLDARAGDLQAVRAAGILASNKGATMNRTALSERILEKLAAYFAACSENFVSEGQEFALQISPTPRAS
jgi:hypothetical protein